MVKYGREWRSNEGVHMGKDWAWDLHGLNDSISPNPLCGAIVVNALI